MNNFRKTQILNTLLTGRLRIEVSGKHFYLIHPPEEIRIKSQNIYNDTLHSLRFQDWFTAKKAELMLSQRKIIAPQVNGQLKTLADKIENLKTKLYRSMFSTSDTKKIRKELNLVRDKYAEIDAKKNELFYLTIEGYAARCKLLEIIKGTLYNEETRERVYKSEEMDYYFIDQIIRNRAEVEPSEKEIREIARTNPWRNYWTLSKPNPFKTNILDLSDYQHTLLTYSRMYTSIYENPDCPTDNVLEDDDLCDGWMIIEHEKAKKQRAEKEADQGLGGKMGKAQEIFIPGKTTEDRKRIRDMNDIGNQVIKAQRQKVISQSGEVKDINLPDKKMEMNRKSIEQFKGRGKQR